MNDDKQSKDNTDNGPTSQNPVPTNPVPTMLTSSIEEAKAKSSNKENN